MRIGILTEYFCSRNYGGILQSYALTYYIEKYISETVEQICFNRDDMGAIHDNTSHICPSFAEKMKKAINPIKLCKYLKKKYQDALYDARCKRNVHNFAIRTAAFSAFETEIPHSKNVYTIDNIASCASDYDLLITGSDQVWNYTWFREPYFLTFSKARKISYAASIGHGELPEPWKDKYKELLKDFSAISVREEEAVELVAPISPVPVEWVLDPTLLLSTAEWDEICAPRMIKDKYMFCYFLGGSKRDRELAKQVARRKKLKIVTLPHLLGEYRKEDAVFGNIRLWDVSPKQFISLIKYADFVLTDSFHGSVFSNIYRKPFAVFNRSGANFEGMGGRIKSLCSLTSEEDRYLNSEEKLTADYICSLPAALPEETEQMKQMREKSKEFLKASICSVTGE